MDREGGSNGGSSYYAVLGIRKDASFSDVRTAYRKLAMVIHHWKKEKKKELFFSPFSCCPSPSSSYSFLSKSFFVWGKFCVFSNWFLCFGKQEGVFINLLFLSQFWYYFLTFYQFSACKFQFLIKFFLFFFKFGRGGSPLKKWHPDKWVRNQVVAAEAKWRFQQIQEAYSGRIYCYYYYFLTPIIKSSCSNFGFYLGYFHWRPLLLCFHSSLGPIQEVNVRRRPLQPSWRRRPSSYFLLSDKALYTLPASR